MKSYMKKALRIILGLVFFTAVILAGSEKPDGGICFWWTAMWMAVAFVSAVLLDKTSTHKTPNNHETEHQ